MSLRRAGAVVLVVAMFAALPGRGLAQSGQSVVTVPEAPPVASAPSSAMPDGALPAPDLPNAPTLPGDQGGAFAGPATPKGSQATPPAPPKQVKPIWDPRQAAILDVLEKADGAVNRIIAPVGSSFTEGALRVTIGACVVRPADMPPDAAVYMTVRHGMAAPDLFRGWLIRSEPGATVVGDAAVTFRLIGCSAG